MSSNNNVFIKVHVRLATHAAVLDVDHSVDHVYTLVLRVARAEGVEGVIAADAVTPRRLRRRFGIPDDLLDSYLERGLKGCFDGGLLAREGDRVVVCDWSKHYSPAAQTPAERKAAERARKAQAATTEAASREKRDSHEPVTGSHSVTTEEKRREEKRSVDRDVTAENNPPSRDAAGAGETSPEPPIEAQAQGAPADTPRRKARPDAQQLEATALRVYAFWVQTMGKTEAAARTATSAGRKRLANVRARLADGYTEAQLRQAIEACRDSPYHRGENATGTVFQDLELITRPLQLDAFLSRARASPKVVGGLQLRTAEQIAADAAEARAREADQERRVQELGLVSCPACGGAWCLPSGETCSGCRDSAVPGFTTPAAADEQRRAAAEAQERAAQASAAGGSAVDPDCRRSRGAGGS